MFTGLIEAIGSVRRLQQLDEQTLRLQVDLGTLDPAGIQVGASIAVNGVCLTAVRLTDNSFEADVSGETLERTCLGKMAVGDRVNLEQAMLPTTRLGGHIVSGHIDGVGKVLSMEPAGLSLCCQIEAPEPLARYLAEKGSVAVDGISLTVNRVEGAVFSLNLVPHTASHTIASGYQPGTAVNLEVDVVARYLERLLQCPDTAATAPALTRINELSGGRL